MCRKAIYYLLLIMLALFSRTLFATNIPILCYHNFNPTVPGLMNLTPQRLDEQLKWLKENNFTVIPLKEAVEYLQGKSISLPAKPVVITIDDGWKSAYTYLLPLVQKYHIPVTLFIYPETIAKGKHALTWDELKELQHTGLFDIQSHTYSHPNFKVEKKQLSDSAYEKFVTSELVRSKKILEEKLDKQITLLAWPFGIYDDYLEAAAEKAGYVMAFSIDAHKANRSYNRMDQPRFMILERQSMNHFIAIVKEAYI